MNLKKIEKAVHAIAPSILVEEYRGCVRLSGELDSWDKIYLCGRASVSKKSLGVLNDIKLKGFSDSIRKPVLVDSFLEGKKLDVLVIGGGICGCAVLRELQKLNLSTLLVEKASDVATATTSRNDGCIHAGIDLHKNQQKYKYVVPGNDCYTQLSKDLKFKLERCSQIGIFSTNWEYRLIGGLCGLYSKYMGIKGVRRVSNQEIFDIDGHFPSWAKGGLMMGSAGVISPYKVTIALAENAIENGGEISLNTIVEDMIVENGVIKAVKTNRGTLYPKLVINCAGTFSDIIAEMAGDRTFTIHPKKGVDIILDKKKMHYSKSTRGRAPFTPLPPEAQVEKKNVGYSKGGGIIRTVDGNILIGPNASEVPYREDVTTTMDDINEIFLKQRLCAPELSYADIITYFAGVRAATYEEDFVVRRGIFTSNIIQVAGIQSPGVTSAPAIACEVRDWVKEDLNASLNKNFNPCRKNYIPLLNEMDDSERTKYIKSNPLYGEIICRCEEISKGEIIDALNSPLKVATVDGIKRRVRPGMGRCQGGFCSPLIAKIVAEQANIQLEEVLKGENGSNILFRNTKKAMGANKSVGTEKAVAPKKVVDTEKAVAPKKVVDTEKAVAPKKAVVPKKAVATKKAVAPKNTVATKKSKGVENE